MRLRTILLLISLLAVLSAASGGYFYFSALRESAFKEAERMAVTRVKLLRKTISSYLSENIRPVRALAGMDELLELLVRPGPGALESVNRVLDHFKASLEVDVCYLMNDKGVTVASSNRDAPDSFVGQSFAFRPYFKEAIHNAPATYLALGVTSQKRGAYYSYPVFEKGRNTPIGLAVIKASIDFIEKELGLESDEIVLVADPRGVVFISNRAEWLFQLLNRLPPEEIEKIAASRQFGRGPWEWSGLAFSEDRHVTDAAGKRYQMHAVDIENHPGWQIIHLRSMRAIANTLLNPLIQITGPIVLALCTFIGLTVFLLYRKASGEIAQRRSAEKALRESEERFRDLYHHTPAMLHSIDTGGRLVSVSNYWSELMGYRREEVIGQDLTRFLTAQSRRYARETVFPQFFRDGFCRDIPYQFVKKNGETIDVLLSAIADRDRDGNISRTLAVSMDVTERMRAEEQLKLAKEALSRYSKDLEEQVRIRTREIRNAQDQLRRLSGSIMANQEKERAALARELHDELGQVLTALRMDAVWLNERLKKSDAAAADRALTMCQLIDREIEEVRGMTFRLRPGVLDDLGLVDALDWYTTDFERRTEITCIFEHRTIPALPETVATAAYRISQEALTNVARHANAGRVEVRLRSDNGTLVLAVEDDGAGFDELNLSESKGLGIAGMRERATLVGGTLTVTSRPGGGTAVYFKVPMSKQPPV